MNLPVRIAPGYCEPAIRVDGVDAGAAGLHLSHWPGNATPAALRHELSTGSALLFAALGTRERERLSGDARCIVNNHYDTDGTCALFAVRHPELAREHADALLAAAACGDFFRLPDEHAFRIECIVQAVADPQRSPLRAELAQATESDDTARYQRATEYLFEIFPALLAGDAAPWRELWEPELEALRCDLADVDASARDDIVHLGWTIWTAPPGRASARRGARRFDPGRHAFWGRSEADRVLAIGPGTDDGTTYRLLLSTRSWFDLPDGPGPNRPDLAALAAALQELEGDTGEYGWRAQAANSPSPELWFGRDGAAPFQEHCPELAPSRLAPSVVRRVVADTFRRALGM